MLWFDALLCELTFDERSILFNSSYATKPWCIFINCFAAYTHQYSSAKRSNNKLDWILSTIGNLQSSKRPTSNLCKLMSLDSFLACVPVSVLVIRQTC